MRPWDIIICLKCLGSILSVGFSIRLFYYSTGNVDLNSKFSVIGMARLFAAIKIETLMMTVHWTEFHKFFKIISVWSDILQCRVYVKVNYVFRKYICCGFWRYGPDKAPVKSFG